MNDFSNKRLGLEIFIDPESTSYLELGTQQHPYKTIVPAFGELFNFLPVKVNDY